MTIPILKAVERDEEGNLCVFCPHCNTFHNHGKGDGHRIAHCTKEDSPFHETGYILEKIIVGNKEQSQ